MLKAVAWGGRPAPLKAEFQRWGLFRSNPNCLPNRPGIPRLKGMIFYNLGERIKRR